MKESTFKILIFWVVIPLMILAGGILAYIVASDIYVDLREQHIEKNNPDCLTALKIEYCSQFGMEVKHKIIGGIGSPREIQICSGPTGEKRVTFTDLDYNRCG